jgi:hypothetical protein
MTILDGRTNAGEVRRLVECSRRLHQGACILIAVTIGDDLDGLPLLTQNRFCLNRGERDGV